MVKKKPINDSKDAIDSAKMAVSKASKMTGDVFENLKKHLEPKKVDAFQKKWLSVPENRKKYEKISDAPQVATEEILAITNDLIQFAQGQKGGSSKLIEKIKAKASGFFKNPAKLLQDQVQATQKPKKDVVKKVKSTVKKKVVKKVDKKR